MDNKVKSTEYSRASSRLEGTLSTETLEEVACG